MVYFGVEPNDIRKILIITFEVFDDIISSREIKLEKVGEDGFFRKNSEFPDAKLMHLESTFFVLHGVIIVLSSLLLLKPRKRREDNEKKFQEHEEKCCMSRKENSRYYISRRAIKYPPRFFEVCQVAQQCVHRKWKRGIAPC